jgi:hypothetical protein
MEAKSTIDICKTATNGTFCFEKFRLISIILNDGFEILEKQLKETNLEYVHLKEWLASKYFY